jgi:ubiquinone/menaquinone biosynthesis C-methylase UbiE
MGTNWKYRLGDLMAGVAIGGMVALAHRLLVPQSLGIIGGVLVGMFVGMGAQMLSSLVLGSFLGSMEMMIPGMFVGMLGMVLPLFQFRILRTELLLSGGIGFLVFLAFTVWDERLKGRAQSLRCPDDLGLIKRNGSKQNSSASAAWWNAAWLYDALEEAGSQRRGHFQRELFRKMSGRVLFGAAGTGLNFVHFPAGKEIVAIDISARMLEAARARASCYDGPLSLQQADLEQLPFVDESFDTAATASTFCSVADPVQGLKELYRVLKPNGKLLMFEHVSSRNPLLGAELDLMNLALHFLGPSMNRDTVGNVQRAGFAVDRVVCAYLDIFVAIEAHKPATVALPARGRS